MQEHIKIYFKHFDHKLQSDVFCEVCGSQAVDIHHIKGRGKEMNAIGNLAGIVTTNVTMKLSNVNKCN